MAREFEWDEIKRLSNMEKHGLGEERSRAYFRVAGAGRALSFTWRAERIRVISLRPAREREMRRHGL